jgi:hypothetical protein
MQGMIHLLFILWFHQSECYYLESQFLGKLSKGITANFLNPKRMYKCGKVNKLSFIFHIREVQYALIVGCGHKQFKVEDTTME